MAKLADSGAILGPIWRPKSYHKQAPTPENLKGFRDAMDELRYVFYSKHVGATTQNSMNSHVLALVGGNFWATEMEPMRIRILPGGVKQHEFPVFGGLRTVASREGFRLCFDARSETQ